jgi:Isoprenylcysteine carboxyl methyltransferase (ICMT) family
MDIAQISPKVDTAAPRPPSAVSSGVGVAGVAGLVIWVLIARHFAVVAGALSIQPGWFGYDVWPERASGAYAALLCVMAVGIPMVAWSLLVDKVHLRKSTGIDWTLARPVADVLDTSVIKIAGIWATWAIIAVGYSMFRFYWQSNNWNFPFAMQMFQYALLPLVIASVPYIVWLDRYLVNPRDGSWHFGAWIAGRNDWDKDEIFHHLRAWAVKGFFLAFMISIVPGGFQFLVNVDFAKAISQPVSLTQLMITSMFVIDVQLATVGYLLTMKPLDAHIRTANPYLGGWVAALACYPPFILLNNGQLIDYTVGTSGDNSWHFWFAGHDALLYAWGAILVALTAIYAWATMAFGLRFSNLTHRGILTHGPYAFTKHPAYLSKNSFWWLAVLPFLVTNGSMADAVRNTVMLCLVSAIYYWRARTEEKHLMADPDYAEYAAWMERNAPIPRFFVKLRRLAGGRLRRDMQPEPAE